MIIAVDFDGTILNDAVIDRNLISRLIREQRAGNIVILWTCREGEKLAEALRICRKCGFVPNYVNENAIETKRRFGIDSRKVYADVYIDDKAVMWR